MSQSNDIVVKTWARCRVLDKEHPAHGNALIFGVITGMNLCLHRAKIAHGGARNTNVLDLLRVFTDLDKSVDEILSDANDSVMLRESFTVEMFECATYMTSPSRKYYSEGVGMGMRYLADVLFDAESVPGVSLTESYDFVEWAVRCLKDVLKGIR